MIDLNQLENDSNQQADICIIGAGAMGLALANEFSGSHLQVLLLESGGWEDEPETQHLCQLIHAGTPLPNVAGSRFRIFGGTTTRWGGQALPFFPIDFEQRDWVAHSGWPVAFSELAQFYARASAFMRIDSLNYDTDLFRVLGVHPPDFDSNILRYHFSKWAPEPNLRKLYAPLIKRSGNVRVLLHANVTDIVLGENRPAVDHLMVQSLGGKRARISAKVFILAAGAIETARILLACNKQMTTGLGNAHDLVGRFFQEHPTRRIGQFAPADNRAVQRLFHLFYRGGWKYSVRCSAAESMLRSRQLLNVTAGLDFETARNSPYVAMKNVARGLLHGQFNKSRLSDVKRTAMGIPRLLRPAYQYFVSRRGYSPDAICKAWIMTEQEPNRDSRVTLSERRDVLGMPIAEINWQVTYSSWRTMVEYAQMIRQQLLGIGLHLELFPEITLDNPDWRTLLGDSLHHIGTARMADSPAEGVVDPQCRVFDIQNLFVSGSAVFPTSGHSNPTLTALALAIRLADHVKAGAVA